jgi:hypothetical protein
MKKISGSPLFLFYFKTFLPVFWFGFFACYIVICFLGVFFGGHGEGFLESSLTFLGNAIGALVMGAIGYIAFIRQAWELVDEVFDNGNGLIFRKGRKEQRVNLCDITSIKRAWLWSMMLERIIICTRSEGVLGKRLVFVAPMTLLRRSPLLYELMERVDQAKNS